ncbi:leader peptide SpeFL [Actinobacillus delphinicola]|nr:leader peptide SpeFL [Actinobacillus delphinicola]
MAHIRRTRHLTMPFFRPCFSYSFFNSHISNPYY